MSYHISPSPQGRETGSSTPRPESPWTVRTTSWSPTGATPGSRSGVTFNHQLAPKLATTNSRPTANHHLEPYHHHPLIAWKTPNHKQIHTTKSLELQPTITKHHKQDLTQVFDQFGSFLSYVNTSGCPLYGPQVHPILNHRHPTITQSSPDRHPVVN